MYATSENVKNSPGSYHPHRDVINVLPHRAHVHIVACEFRTVVARARINAR